MSVRERMLKNCTKQMQREFHDKVKDGEGQDKGHSQAHDPGWKVKIRLKEKVKV